MQILTPDELTAQIDAEQEQRLGNERYQPTPLTDALAGHVKSCWSQAQNGRSVLNERMLKCLRARRGEYDPDKLAAIKQMGGSMVYMRLTSAKCAAAKAWLSDIFTPAGDRPWRMHSTPIPSLPEKYRTKLVMEAVQGAMALNVPLDAMKELIDKHEDRIKDELKQEADKRAERMSQKIFDIMIEGGWREEFEAFLDDLTTQPFAVFKGPIYRRKKRLKWKAIEGSNEYEPEAGFEIVRQFKRVSPFDFYPSPSAVDVNDDWVIERHRMTASDLSAMRGAAGYHGHGIALALADYRIGGLREWTTTDGDRDRLEGRENVTNNTTIEALEWTGKLQGQMLLDWGMTRDAIPDPVEEYLVSVMVVGNYVIRALVNPDPTDRNDYYKATWRTVPNSFAGEALPEMLSDCQGLCNAAARALANNMGIASGPMVYYLADRIAQGTDVSTLHPWKLFGATESRTGSTAQPVGFFQPSSNASELMAIYDRFSRYGDEITGLPAYSYGSDSAAGAGRTASGLSMLLSGASRSVKQTVRNIDINVVEPCIRKLYNHLMLDPTVDSKLKGDLQIHAIGSEALLHKEANQAMQQQFLAQTANPIDMQIIGLEGRRELLREAAKSLSVPVDRIIPSDEMMELRQMEMMAQQGMQQPAPNSENPQQEMPQNDS